MSTNSLFSDTVTSSSCGCLTFDIELARSTGWTEQEIADTYAELVAVYRHTQRAVMMRNAHNYLVLAADPLFRDPLYIGPTPDSPAMSEESVASLLANGHVRLSDALKIRRGASL